MAAAPDPTAVDAVLGRLIACHDQAGGPAPLLAFGLITATPENATWPVSLMFVLSAVAVLLGVLWDRQQRVI